MCRLAAAPPPVSLTACSPANRPLRLPAPALTTLADGAAAAKEVQRGQGVPPSAAGRPSVSDATRDVVEGSPDLRKLVCQIATQVKTKASHVACHEGGNTMFGPRFQRRIRSRRMGGRTQGAGEEA